MKEIIDKEEIRKIIENNTEKIPGSCWLWKGSKTDGYGNLGRKINGKQCWFLVHKLSAYLYLNYNYGDYDINNLVLHKRICPNRHCVNPDHLYIGTAQQNILDREIIGTRKVHKHKQFCKYGHELTEENTYIQKRWALVSKDGTREMRSCKICRNNAREKSRRKYACS